MRRVTGLTKWIFHCAHESSTLPSFIFDRELLLVNRNVRDRGYARIISIYSACLLTSSNLRSWLSVRFWRFRLNLKVKNDKSGISPHSPYLNPNGPGPKGSFFKSFLIKNYISWLWNALRFSPNFTSEYYKSIAIEPIFQDLSSFPSQLIECSALGRKGEEIIQSHLLRATENAAPTRFRNP